MKKILLLMLLSVMAQAEQCEGVGPDDNCNGPPWIAYCDTRWALNLACTRDMYENGIYTTIPAVGSTSTYIPAYVPQAMGNSSTAVSSAFPAILAGNIAGNAANLDAQILNGIELLPRMSTELQAFDTGGYTQQILITAAQNVSATSLQYLASVFGPAAINGVLGYAPPQVQAAYYALPTPNALPFSAYYYAQQGRVSPFTGSSSYLMDVLLETYFLGTDSVLVAEHKTQQYAMSVLHTSNLEMIKAQQPEPPYGGPVLFWTTIIVQFVEVFDPELGPQIEGALAAISVDPIVAGYNAANAYGWNMSPWGNTVVGPGVLSPPQEEGDNSYDVCNASNCTPQY